MSMVSINQLWNIFSMGNSGLRLFDLHARSRLFVGNTYFSLSDRRHLNSLWTRINAEMMMILFCSISVYTVNHRHGHYSNSGTWWVCMAVLSQPPLILAPLPEIIAALLHLFHASVPYYILQMTGSCLWACSVSSRRSQTSENCSRDLVQLRSVLYWETRKGPVKVSHTFHI